MRATSLLAALGAAAIGLSEIVDGQWKTLAEIPYNVRQEHYVVAHGNETFYILGGIIPVDPAVLNVTTTVNIVQSVSS